jgi:X-Pro dipeptidyl-peptidase-like protein
VSYVSAPLTGDTTAIGAGAVNLWVKSSTPNVDLQATVSEVRPDGSETFVQNGWIRASERKLATTSTNMLDQVPTPLQPIPTFLVSDEQPMPADEFVPVTIPLYFEGHVYRAGSRIRVTVAAPNGTQPVWSFSQTQPEGTTANVSIAFGPGMPASVTLPIVPGVNVPTGLAALPEPAQRALPALPGIRKRRFLNGDSRQERESHRRARRHRPGPGLWSWSTQRTTRAARRRPRRARRPAYVRRASLEAAAALGAGAARPTRDLAWRGDALKERRPLTEVSCWPNRRTAFQALRRWVRR